MAYKKDIKSYLKSVGLTWDDMDRIWEEVCEVNKKCQLIKNSGKSWSDLSILLISKLPTLKEDTLRQLEEKAKEEEIKSKMENERLEKEKYYSEHFDEILVNKIDNNEPLTLNELSEMRESSIERSYGENRRWQRSVTDICKLCERYFCLNWEEGLTESQEDDFLSQPYEVYPHSSLVIKESVSYTRSKKKDDFDVFDVCSIDEIVSTVKDMLVQTPKIGSSSRILVSDDCIVIKK